jgi:hypothetical protein
MIYHSPRSGASASYGSAFINKTMLNLLQKNKISLLASLLFLCLFSFGCAKQIEMIPVNKRPLPSGEVTSIEQKGGATVYGLKISHLLLSPRELDPQATVYIVWAISTQENSVEKLAQFHEGIKDSKSMVVETKIVYPRFTVTAESDPSISNPTGPAIIKDFYISPDLREQLGAPVH